MKTGRGKMLPQVIVRATLALAIALAPGAVGAQALPRILKVRTGSHAAFSRVVIVLDSPAQVELRPAEVGWLELHIGARGEATERPLGRTESALGQVGLTSVSTGTLLVARLDGRRARVFALPGPPRLVLDVAPPGDEEFRAPPDSVAIVEHLAKAAPPAEPPPEPVRSVPQRRRRGRTIEEVPEVNVPDDVLLPDSVPGPQKRDEPVRTGPEEVLPPIPKIDRSQFHGRPRAPRAPVGGPWPAQQSGFSVPGLGWLLGGAAVLVVGSIALAKRDGSERGAESASLSETSRLDALEKQLDDQARERLMIEDRLGQLQEELKVVRDRVNRISRGREG